ncbi:MAG: HEAT repeat domain-containing protein [Myxococcales bacterium]|nr:HEAT repeat domain-containing protein [Myxococcales bacterium]MCB9545367.1 HEAT repeat domain-containing protein [Myxococcales bacterium]
MIRLLVALGLLLPALTGADAWAQDGETVDTVRYSYEKWSRGGQAQYVLEPMPISIKKGGLKDRANALFRVLSAAKSGSYGKAALAFRDDVDQTGIIWVHLDPEKARYNPIVMAETTYTFTENGATRVIFPKVFERGWTRDDVPFAAYTLTVPLWQTLPPAGIGGALARLPDGSYLGSDDAIARLQKGDAALIEAAWSYTKSGPPAAAVAVIQAVPALKLKDGQERLIEALKSSDAAIRGAALDGLDGQDAKAVNEALRAVMDKDAEESLRDKASVLLSKSKDPTFSTAAQYHALRSKDAKVVAAAATALGDSPLPEAGQQLIATLGHPEAEVRTAVVASLLKRKDLPALVAALKNQELALAARIEAARALASGDDKASAHPALVFLTTNANGADSAGAAAKLATFDKPESYEALGKAVKHAEAETRLAAAGALGRLAKPTGLALLAAADVADAESGDAMLTAIRAIYGAQSLDFVMKATKESNKTLQREAVATLGRLVEGKAGAASRKTIAKALEPLGASSDPLIRAAAARSYENMPGDDVKPELLKLAKDSAVEVKRAAARSLRAFPGADTVSLLLGYIGEADAELLANAIESLGVLQEKEALDRIVNHKDHKEVRVRRAVTAALVGIGGALDQPKRAPLLSFFSEKLFDKDAVVRRAAVEGLRLVKDPRTVTALAALLKDPDKEVRQATLNAMASTGDASAVETIATGLEDDDADVRRTAILALGELKQKAAAKVLLDYAKTEKDAALADQARQVAGGLK